MGTGGTELNTPGGDGVAATEVSDWGVAEIITWDRHLSASEMEGVHQYLVDMLSAGNTAPPAPPAGQQDQQASAPVQLAEGEMRFVEVLAANSAGSDESLVTVSIETEHSHSRSCAQILADAPASETGVYTIDPAGTGMAFEVVCDMDTEGGGWTMLTLANSAGLTTWHGVLMAQHSASNGWGKCTDDDAAMFFEGVGEDSVEAAAVGYDDNTFELRYARPDTGEVYTTEQMDALRTQSTQLSTNSRIVAATADDDDGSWETDQSGGHEVYIYDTSGAEMLLTPGEDGQCSVDSADDNAQTGFRLWSTDTHQSSTAGSVRHLTAPLPTLPGNFALPKYARLVVDTGGGCAFGYEQRTILVKPGNQWTPAVDTAVCSNPELTDQAACEAVNQWTPATTGDCSNADLTPLGQQACEEVNTWDADTSTCSNTRDSCVACVGSTVCDACVGTGDDCVLGGSEWKQPVWRSYCQVDPGTPRAATLTCSTPADTRVSACAIGYKKVSGASDDPATADVDEATADTCEPNTCAWFGSLTLRSKMSLFIVRT